MLVNDDSHANSGDFLDFQSGYIQRSIDKFPKMGNRLPWRLAQLYPLDLVMLRFNKIDDGKLKFSKATGQIKSSQDKTSDSDKLVDAKPAESLKL